MPRSRQSAPRRPAAGRFYSILKAIIPWWQGKMQGISPIQPFFAKIRLKNICEFSNLRDEFVIGAKVGAVWATLGRVRWRCVRDWVFLVSLERPGARLDRARNGVGSWREV